MQLSRTKFQKSFILSTKKWIKCFPGENPVNSRGKSGDITGAVLPSLPAARPPAAIRLARGGFQAMLLASPGSAAVRTWTFVFGLGQVGLGHSDSDSLLFFFKLQSLSHFSLFREQQRSQNLVEAI